MTDYTTDADLLPIGIRLTAARKQALERLAGDLGMSLPMFIEAFLAVLLADAGCIKMQTAHDDTQSAALVRSG